MQALTAIPWKFFAISWKQFAALCAFHSHSKPHVVKTTTQRFALLAHSYCRIDGEI